MWLTKSHLREEIHLKVIHYLLEIYLFGSKSEREKAEREKENLCICWFTHPSEHSSQDRAMPSQEPGTHLRHHTDDRTQACEPLTTALPGARAGPEVGSRT